MSIIPIDADKTQQQETEAGGSDLKLIAYLKTHFRNLIRSVEDNETDVLVLQVNIINLIEFKRN